jgi:hypothetical protein
MFASIRRYVVHKVAVSELARRVSDDFVDLIARQPGFVSYELVDGEGGEFLTISAFEQEAQAETSRVLARRWTERHLQDIELTLTETLRGEVQLRRSRGAASARDRDGPTRAYASFRLYQTPMDVRELVATSGERFAGLVEAVAGFRDYRILDCGAGQLLSVGLFNDPAAAAAFDDLAMQFVRTELAASNLRRSDMIGGGEVLISRVIE